jgi:lysophospholipase L1-like esterase
VPASPISRKFGASNPPCTRGELGEAQPGLTPKLVSPSMALRHHLMKLLLRLAGLAAIFACLLPVVRGAETNHNFAKWEREIAAFERSDATNPPAPGGCLFIGSSGIRFWKTLAADFPDQRVINRGFGGSEIVDSTHFADRIVFPYAPRLIFLRAGGNDLWAGKPVAEVVNDFKDFVAKVHGRLPDAKIIFISLSPSIARWKQHDQELAVNALAREFAATQPYLHYINDYDMALGPDGTPRPELYVADKLHFNAAGYKLLAATVRAGWPAN